MKQLTPLCVYKIATISLVHGRLFLALLVGSKARNVVSWGAYVQFDAYSGATRRRQDLSGRA